MSDSDATPEIAAQQVLRLKQRRLELLNEKLAVRADNKLAYLTPFPGCQQGFFENSGKKRRALFMGNKGGKTLCGSAEDIAWALGYRPWYPEGHPLRRLGIPEEGVKGLVIAEDWDKVREMFTEKGDKSDKMGRIFEWLPKWAFAGHHVNRTSGVIDIIYVQSEINGQMRKSMLCFDTVQSFQNNAMSHESTDWDFVHWDEPGPPEMRVALERGLVARNGASWWLATLIRHPWMYYHMVDNCANDPEHYWMQVGDTDENLTLTAEAKKIYFDSLSTDVLNCRKRGLPMEMGMTVYSNYDEKIHVPQGLETPVGWPGPLEPPPDWNRAYAIDPHGGKPHAVLFVAWDEKSIVFYHEIWEKCLLEKLVERILAVKQKQYFNYERCDPIAWNSDPVTGRVWAQTFWEKGLRPLRAPKDPVTGIIQTQSIWSDKNRRVIVLPRLKRFRKEIRIYHFDEEGKAVAEENDIMECLYRLTLVTNGFRYRENPPPKSETAGNDGAINDEVSDMALPAGNYDAT